MNRRSFLQTGVTSAAVLALQHQAQAYINRSTAAHSDFVYLSPSYTTGALRRCHAEVWYVMLGTDLYVCLGSGSWHAQAACKDTNKTKLRIAKEYLVDGVGDQNQPTIDAVASVEDEPAKVDAVLRRFGAKYPAYWETWGPKFKRGLRDGSRVLLRYELSDA